MELESSDLSDIPPPPQSDGFDSDDCDALHTICCISCGDSNAKDRNSNVDSNDDSVETESIELISTRCYFENDGDYEYDGSVSDALSDHSIEEDDSFKSSSATTAMHHLHTLQTFVVILEAFGLRCAFDHWMRGRNVDSSVSTPMVLDDSMDSHVEEDGCDNHIMDHSNDIMVHSNHIMDHLSISSSSEILLNEMLLKESLAFDVMDRVLSTATIRGALCVWSESSKRISRIERLRLQCKMVEAQAFLRRHRTLEKVLRSWRDATLLTLKRRQKYFLMALFNRWQLYTDECIEIRQKRDTALLHWATFKIKKAFVILKLHAKQSQIAREEERRLDASLQSSSNRVGLTNEMDALRKHRFGAPSALNCYRGPTLPTVQMSLPSRRIPDYRASSTRNWFDSIRPTSSMRQISPPIRREFTTQSSVRPTKFYSEGMTSPFTSQSSVSCERQTSAMAGSNSYFAQDIDPTTSRQNFHLTFNSSANCLGFHERFITSCILDEMIAIVEHKHSTAAGAEQS